jgi:hypothetical protein
MWTQKPTPKQHKEDLELYTKKVLDIRAVTGVSKRLDVEPLRIWLDLLKSVLMAETAGGGLVKGSW